MFTPRAYSRLSIACAHTLVTLFTTSAYGQSPGELEKEVAAVKAENAAVREQLRKMEEQQTALVEMVDRLQRRLDAPTTADAQSVGKPIGSTTTNEASVPAAMASPPVVYAGDTSVQQTSATGQQRSVVVTRTELSSGRLPTTPRCLSC